MFKGIFVKGMCGKFGQSMAVLLIVFWSGVSFANKIEQQREHFLQVERLILSNKWFNFAKKTQDLKEYPLYFYLQYEWLNRHLSHDKAIKHFLATNHSRYSHKLRRQWLNNLYKRKKWATFVGNFKTSSSVYQQCRYQWARYQLNYKGQALKATKDIWLTGTSLPKVCNPLLRVFTKSKFLTQSLIWRRFKLAIKTREIKLARYLKAKLSSKRYQIDAEYWLKIVKKPTFLKKPGSLRKVSRSEQSEMLVYVIRRLVNRNVDQAVALWKKRRGAFKLSTAQKTKIEKGIALQYAFDKSPKAYRYFKGLNSLDKTSRAWFVRAALLSNDWMKVQYALNKLSAKEKLASRWQYWQARTFLYRKKTHKAETIFKRLAHERGYYGFIAADYLKQDYDLNDKPIKVDDKKYAALLASDDFVIMAEFKALGYEKTAKRYWWNAVQALDKSQRLLAAKIAEQWQWHKQAILAVSMVKHWDDVRLRFPMDFTRKIKENSQLKKLDESIIYALIRRESMFDELVESPVGALGLMQIMPNTGKQIAKQMKMKWTSKSKLLEADLNIHFGSFYYKEMLGKFDNHYALAAAAYNAGPHRVTRWLKSHRVLGADVWVETIPYKETREYVAAVLTYALIYQQRLGKKGMNMQDFLKDIKL